MANLINVLYLHEGRTYDIQAEDMGPSVSEVDLRIYSEGALIFQKRIAYRDQTPADAGPVEHDQMVRALMVRNVEALKKGIASGRMKA